MPLVHTGLAPRWNDAHIGIKNTFLEVEPVSNSPLHLQRSRSVPFLPCHSRELPLSSTPTSPSSTATDWESTELTSAQGYGVSPMSRYFEGSPCSSNLPTRQDKFAMELPSNRIQTPQCMDGIGCNQLAMDGSGTCIQNHGVNPGVVDTWALPFSALGPQPSMMVLVPFPCQWEPAPEQWDHVQGSQARRRSRSPRSGAPRFGSGPAQHLDSRRDTRKELPNAMFVDLSKLRPASANA